MQIYKNSKLIENFLVGHGQEYGQSGVWALELMELNDFLHASTNSCKLKGDLKF